MDKKTKDVHKDKWKHLLKKNQKTKMRTHSGNEKKRLDYIDEKQKIYMKISRDIFREKKNKQKTRVRTHSGDEKKLTGLYR